MSTNTPLSRTVLMGAVVLVLAAGTGAQGPAKSSAAARQLAAALDAQKLDSIAAPDPASPNRFVAALYFPGAQLLLVAAEYSAPSLLTAKIAQKDYRDIYIDLNAASVPGTKLFIMDQGADGLSARPDDGAPDSFEQGNKSVSFDGDWRRAKMSEQDYTSAFAAADEQYARLLTVLAEAAKKNGSGS
jgi:hypothetical protein